MKILNRILVSIVVPIMTVASAQGNKLSAAADSIAASKRVSPTQAKKPPPPPPHPPPVKDMVLADACDPTPLDQNNAAVLRLGQFQKQFKLRDSTLHLQAICGQNKLVHITCKKDIRWIGSNPLLLERIDNCLLGPSLDASIVIHDEQGNVVSSKSKCHIYAVCDKFATSAPQASSP